MLVRTALAVSFSGLVLAVGTLTACLAAFNRAHRRDLDERQRWCETYGSRNDLLRDRNMRDQWRLEHGEAPEEEIQVEF